jgi:hypothetical protein
MFSAGNKELPPRFKNKIMLAQQQGQGNLEDVSLRPAPMSMMFKPTNTKPVLLNPGMFGCGGSNIFNVLHSYDQVITFIISNIMHLYVFCLPISLYKGTHWMLHCLRRPAFHI